MGRRERELLIEIENYAFLARCYGAPFATAVEAELHERVSVLCGRRFRVITLGGGRLGVGWWSDEGTSAEEESLGQKAFVDWLLMGLADWSKRECGASSLAIVCADWVRTGEIRSLFLGAGMPKDRWSQSRVCADMEVAAQVYQAIGRDRLELVFQPICNTHDPQSVLYHESLVRMRLDDGGDLVFPNAFIPSLERLGLMRCVDRYVMRRAIALMDEYQEISLGVNISAQSAIDDIWWASLFGELAEAPSIARRLVIEITETTRIYPGAGRQFCNRLRQLGCRIAIDDYGAGFGKENEADIREPDIIKIDSSVLRGHSMHGMYSDFNEVVGIAKTKAAQVVVEGIESSVDLEFVKESGVLWGQGRHIAKPVRWFSGEDIYQLIS